MKPYFLTPAKNKSTYVPLWDDSDSFHQYAIHSSRLRTLANSLILLVPSLMALILNVSIAFGSLFPFGLLWYVDIVAFVSGIGILYYTYSKRRGQYKVRFDRAGK